MSAQGQQARHVAIIMDGNGRWAKRRHLPRVMGHRKGVEAVRELVRSLKDTQVECLTLYAFSSENWKRPEDEVDDLMDLMRKFIKSDLPEFIANDVKLHILGDWQVLAPDIVAMLEDALEQTRRGSRTLAVALNYGAQAEIVAAARKAAAGGEITEE
ncbi:MAG: polyprenyl diphosphate synthase, partial [Henriciella sp.]|nr:polyprenyl diphosphate synthase [Henriciella sp.]